ncbi:hypothetical protein F2Q69_00006774 [Brassica cretica]|uniref:Uncharacterized protein n=1 Tax=Brassica cretica TaxID=69181 RepID=A0A8S9NYJ2_BRACR|nr:hypothetical protein F2Q69_00006774 [Brassica cretica]
MSGNTKDKIAVRNNAGKTTPAATAPMANAYANATVFEKIENLAATFRHRKCNETSSRFLFLNIKGNDKYYQTPKESRIRKEMERSPRIKIRPSASLHGLTILPLAPRSVAKISSPGKSSLAPLDHPWLFLNAKKVFDEMLIHFRKSNDTKIETWITKTAILAAA